MIPKIVIVVWLMLGTFYILLEPNIEKNEITGGYILFYTWRKQRK